MNEAEKELNIEQQMFTKNENINVILKRNIVRYIFIIHNYIYYFITMIIVLYRNILTMVSYSKNLNRV